MYPQTCVPVFICKDSHAIKAGGSTLFLPLPFLSLFHLFFCKSAGNYIRATIALWAGLVKDGACDRAMDRISSSAFGYLWLIVFVNKQADSNRTVRFTQRAKPHCLPFLPGPRMSCVFHSEHALEMHSALAAAVKLCLEYIRCCCSWALTGSPKWEGAGRCDLSSVRSIVCIGRSLKHWSWLILWPKP